MYGALFHGTDYMLEWQGAPRAACQIVCGRLNDHVGTWGQDIFEPLVNSNQLMVLCLYPLSSICPLALLLVSVLVVPSPLSLSRLFQHLALSLSLFQLPYMTRPFFATACANARLTVDQSSHMPVEQRFFVCHSQV